MKNNTGNAKDFLVRAIQQMPTDFALQEAKWHMYQALNKIEKVEDKRFKREIIQQEEEKKLKDKKILSDPLHAATNLEVLDKMIREEKENLEKIINKKKTNDGNGYIQTILG